MNEGGQARAITIAGSAVALPHHRISQQALRRSLGELFHLQGPRLAALESVFDNARVSERQSVLAADDLCRPRSFVERNRLYAREAPALASRAVAACLRDGGASAAEVDLLITVSCTGVLRPSLAVQIARAVGLRADVRLLPVNALGCAAGAAALARARDLMLGGASRTALVVAVELASVNFQAQDLRQENLISSALFGDGAAAVLLVRDGDGRPGPQIVTTRSHLFPDTVGTMGFSVEEDGFHIVLSREVPALVTRHARPLVDAFVTEAGLATGDLRWFVLHPGGRRILAGLEDELGLAPGQTACSWQVLNDHGNLSSASVLYVLDRHRRRAPGPPPAGAPGLLAAFGPGFALELALLRG